MDTNTYEQRQETRRERLLAIADKLEREGSARYKYARSLADCIPMGQPILIGHHSERRHRRDLARIHAGYSAAFAAQERAERLRQRAASVGSGGISSDDPQAVDKLKEKLAGMEARREHMNLVNATHRRFMKVGEAAFAKVADQLSAADLDTIRNYKPAYSWEPHPYAPGQFQNLGGNIKRVKGRIEQLSAKASEIEATGGVSQVTECKGYTVIENVEWNRLQLKFPGKPSQEVRTLLKRSGFRWSPTAGAWQRMLSGFAYHVKAEDGYLRKELEALA